jgi:twitching motility protein PilU
MLTTYVSDLIQKGRVDEIKEVMSKGGEVGMHTFDQSLFNLYTAGRISLKDALHYADSHTDLALRVRLSDQHTAADAPSLTVNEILGTHNPRK